MISMTCNGCTTGNKAVAKCAACAGFLCEQCRAMHSVMKLFVDHSVEELTLEDQVTKSIYCCEHKNKFVEYFCQLCLSAICCECLTSKHHQHPCEHVIDIEKILREDLKDKVSSCAALKHGMQEDFEVLLQRSRAINDSLIRNCGVIEDVFVNFTTFLEQVRDELLEKNEKVHAQLKMKVVENIKMAQDCIAKIDDALLFTENYLRFGSHLQLSIVYASIVSRCTRLLSTKGSVCITQISSGLPFHSTEQSRQQDELRKAFGHFAEDLAETLYDDSNLSSYDRCVGQGRSEASTVHYSNFSGATLPHEFDLNGVATTNSSASDTLLLADFGGIPATDNLFSSCIKSYSQTSPTASDSGFSDNCALSVIGSGSSGYSTLCSPLSFKGMLGVDAESSLIGDLFQPFNECEYQARAVDTLLNSSGVAISRAPGSPLTRSLTQDPLFGFNFGTHLLSNARETFDKQALARSCSRGPTEEMVAFNPNPNPPFVNRSARCMHMSIRQRWGSLGSNRAQFNSPHGFCLGFEEEIVVADTQNHRIQVFDKSGEFKFLFGVAGREDGQLWYPRKVAVLRSSCRFVVCDRGNERSRMQIFNKNGHFVKKIAIRYIDIVAGLAVNEDGHIVAVDSVAPTVFIIHENGDLLKWFDCSDYMREPSDIGVNAREYFICDFKGHCVTVFQEDGTFLRRIGTESITNFPNGIDISDHGDVLIGDSHGNKFHVAVFTREGHLISEFECPSVKVSRCCGLKISSEGFVVTLAKNNHHVLVLNTLYIV